MQKVGIYFRFRDARASEVLDRRYPFLYVKSRTDYISSFGFDHFMFRDIRQSKWGNFVKITVYNCRAYGRKI